MRLRAPSERPFLLLLFPFLWVRGLLPQKDVVGASPGTARHGTYPCQPALAPAFPSSLLPSRSLQKALDVRVGPQGGLGAFLGLECYYM